MEEVWLIPAIPAAAFVVLLLFGKYLPRGGDFIAIGAIAGLVRTVLPGPSRSSRQGSTARSSFPAGRAGNGCNFGDFEIRVGFFVDPIAIVMLAVVSFVALLVQIYSVGYMRGDPKYGWYFTCMSLFAASMLTLVLADNLLLLYAAWELVGFCSFLLIGFWWERRSAAEAAKKAFITTRIGDVGFLIGILLLWNQADTFDISEIIAFAEDGGFNDADIGGIGLSGNAYLTISVLFLFAGAVGKSGQFPLHVWLPDAMEGPTPVSALIHAATMVVAGVYMVARMFPLFELADDVALDVVTALALITVLLSATMGLVATDIKTRDRVLDAKQPGAHVLGARVRVSDSRHALPSGARLLQGAALPVGGFGHSRHREAGPGGVGRPFGEDAGHCRGVRHRHAGHDWHYSVFRILGQGRGPARRGRAPQHAAVRHNAHQPVHHRAVHDAAFRPYVLVRDA